MHLWRLRFVTGLVRFFKVSQRIKNHIPYCQGHSRFRRSRTVPVVMLLSVSHPQVTTAHPDTCRVAWFTSRRVQPLWWCSWLILIPSSCTWLSDGMICHSWTSEGCWKMADTKLEQRVGPTEQATSRYSHTAACTLWYDVTCSVALSRKACPFQWELFTNLQ